MTKLAFKITLKIKRCYRRSYIYKRLIGLICGNFKKVLRGTFI